jgi:cytochrome c biogenesis protein CcdA
LGVLVGLFEFPCTGGPYLSILSLLHDRASMAGGLGYLLYYNLVFVSPLIVIALVANSSVVVHRLDKWRKKYTKRVDIISSLLMLLLAGVILLSVNS